MILAHVSATRWEKGDLAQPLPLAAPHGAGGDNQLKQG